MFSLVSDDGSCEQTHYINVYETYPSYAGRGYEKGFLALSSMGDDEALYADEHFKLCLSFWICIEIRGKCCGFGGR